MKRVMRGFQVQSDFQFPVAGSCLVSLLPVASSSLALKRRFEESGGVNPTFSEWTFRQAGFRALCVCEISHGANAAEKYA
jgi:hypothetical protein